MKLCSAAFKTELARSTPRLAFCWLLQRTDDTVFAFTTHDANIAFDLEAFVVSMGYGAPPGIVGTGSQTYLAGTSFNATNVQTAAALNVDNLQIRAVMDSASITEEDLRSGTWDYVRFCVFLVCWADTTKGALILRCGRLGDVTTGRTTFVAEMSGLLRAFQNTVGRLTAPGCDADVFDTRCGVSAAGSSVDSPSFPFTATGTLTAVSPDGMTLYDTARTEPGPNSPRVAITGITNANPGRVTMADGSLALINYQTVTLSQILGPVALNGQAQIRNVATDKTAFDLPVDTSDSAAYPPYTSGGFVQASGTSGFFDGGLITMTSGTNNGRSMEVGVYVPGQIGLWMPFKAGLCAIGDTYTMTAGCNKQALGDCKNKFGNVVNFRGMPWLKGNDQLVQVGRRS